MLSAMVLAPTPYNNHKQQAIYRLEFPCLVLSENSEICNLLAQFMSSEECQSLMNKTQGKLCRSLSIPVYPQATIVLGSFQVFAMVIGDNQTNNRLILVQSEFDLYQTSAKISSLKALLKVSWHWVSIGQYWLILGGTWSV